MQQQNVLLKKSNFQKRSERNARDSNAGECPYLASGAIYTYNLYAQCGRWVRGDNNDKSRLTLHGQGALEPARYFQVVLWDRRPLLSVRPADVFHEVWLLELRRWSGNTLTAATRVQYNVRKLKSVNTVVYTAHTARCYATPGWTMESLLVFWSWGGKQVKTSNTPPSTVSSPSQCSTLYCF